MTLTPYGWQDTKPTNAHSFILKPFLTLVEKYCVPSGRIIDLGCGNGAVTSAVKFGGYEVTGIDGSPDGIKLAKESFPNIPFHCASLDDVLEPAVGSEFDLAYSVEVIEHLYYPRNLFRRARELVKPGGYLILSTPYHGYWKNLGLAVLGAWDRHLTAHWDGGHIKFFSEASIRSLASEIGLEFVEFLGVGRAPWLWKSMLVVFKIQTA